MASPNSHSNRNNLSMGNPLLNAHNRANRNNLNLSMVLRLRITLTTRTIMRMANPLCLLNRVAGVMVNVLPVALNNSGHLANTNITPSSMSRGFYL